MIEIVSQEAVLGRWLRKLFGLETAPTAVTLRRSEEPGDSRLLTAFTNRFGGLIIEGLDRGDSVEKYFGEREYEWRWLLSPEEAKKLHRALGKDTDLLTALANRFRDDAAAGLQPFLDEHQIKYEAWSRTGD